MIAIEKNVPIPSAKFSLRRKYPTDTMEVGDSFFVKCSDRDHAFRMRSSINSSGHYLKKKGKRFTVKIVIEGKQIGVRCWRTK